MAKNQIHALIDMLRDTMVAHNVHDAIAAAALLSLPVLVVLWITNRMRHPERSFLSAVTIAFTGLAVVPFVSLGAAALWVRTGGDFIQAAILAPLCSTFSASASSDPGCDPLPAPGGHSPRRFPVPIYPAKSQSFGLR